MPAAGTGITTTTITTTTTTERVTATQAPLLRLLAWLSPAFPTGGFAWSHGIEWAVEARDVRDVASLHDWLDALLRHGTGRSDAILLRHAHRAQADEAALSAVVDLGLAAATARERRAESTGQGNAFVLAMRAWDGSGTDRPRPSWHAAQRDVPYAVAVGAYAGAWGIAEDDAAAGYLHAFAASLISAAVRLIPLGQSAGLAVLAGLEPALLATADATRGATLDDIGGACFRSDLAALHHETQYTRLFRS
jgi:urease accessory protein